MAQLISCNLPGGGFGEQEFSDGAYGACKATNCPSNFHIENSVCATNTKACSILNGIGQQAWNGTGYDACTPASCVTDYVKSGNLCVGPAVVIYRYTPLFNVYYFWSTSTADTNALSFGRTLQGPAFTIYKTIQPEAQIPIYNCMIPGFGTAYIDKAATCNTGVTPSSYTATLLGYISAAPNPSGANKPIYQCTLRGITTTNSAECNYMGTGTVGSTLGYSF